MWQCKARFWQILLLVVLPSLASAQVPVTQMEKEDFEVIRKQYESGFVSQSLQSIKDFNSKYPGSHYESELTFYKGVILINQGQKREGADMLRRFNKFYPDSPYRESALFYLGASEADLKEPDKALETTNQLLREFPETKFIDQANFYLAKAGFYKRDYDFVSSSIAKIKNPSELSQEQSSDLSYINLWMSVEDSTADSFEAAQKIMADDDLQPDQQAYLVTLHVRKLFNLKQYYRASFLAKRVAETQGVSNLPKGEAYYLAGISLLSRFNELDVSGDLSPKKKSSVKKGKPIVISGKTPVKPASIPPEPPPVDILYGSLDMFIDNLALPEPHEKDKSQLHSAEIHLKLKDVVAARQMAQALIKQKSSLAEEPEVHLLLFEVEKTGGAWKAAKEHMLKAISLTKTPERLASYSLALVRLAYKNKDCKTVQEQGSLLVSANTTAGKASGQDEKSETHSYMAFCKLEAQDFAGAAATYALIPESSEYYVRNLKNYIFALQKSGDKDKLNALLAKVDPKSVVKSEEDIVGLRGLKIQSLIDKKDWPEAIAESKAGLASSEGGKSFFYYYLGFALVQSGQKAEGEKNLWESFKAADEKAAAEKMRAATQLIALYESSKNLRKLLGTYSATLPYIEDTKKQSEVLFFIAESYAGKLKNEKEALRWYLRAVREGRYPLNVEASLKVADIYLQNDQFKEALDLLEAMLKKNLEKTPYYAPMNFKVGSIYHYQEKYKQAAEYYKIVVKSSPKSEDGKASQQRLKEINAYLKN